jgi:NADH dehydrogenase
MNQHVRIVIVAGGIAGLLLATRLGNDLGRQGKARITLVDRSPTHVWKPVLHTIAAGTRRPSAAGVRLTHAQRYGFTYRPGEMLGLSRGLRRVHLAELAMSGGEVAMDPCSLDYDVLVLALGSGANEFGTPGVLDHCHFIDSQAQAEHFNEAVRTQIVRSAVESEPLRITIVGAGARGVELAAELSHLLDVASNYGDPSIRGRLQLSLFESAPRVLAAFPPEISESSEALLRSIGFEVLTNTPVMEANSHSLILDSDSSTRADLTVWAAGVRRLISWANWRGSTQTIRTGSSSNPRCRRRTTIASSHWAIARASPCRAPSERWRPPRWRRNRPSTSPSISQAASPESPFRNFRFTTSARSFH